MKGNARSRARRLAMQAIFEWQMTANDPQSIIEQTRKTQNMRNVDDDYFEELVTNITSKVKELDEYIAPLLGRELDEVDLVEKAVLRLGTYELAHRPDVPYKVVINEAVELAKTFGAEQGHRFVNGLMDKLAEKLRAIEMAAHKK
ncbi:MAG: transcription antitermination factor NusB [Thioalkalispiraceae bacterium]|jgi:N utilization substance protein B